VAALKTHEMYCVYLLESVHTPQQRYVGHTDDLKRRLREHNDGKSPHTAKHRPWNLVSYHAFPDEKLAVEFDCIISRRARGVLLRKGTSDSSLYLN